MTKDTVAEIPAASTGGMLFACWAIVIMILLMSLVFLRSKRKDYAMAILPLIITPVIYIISGVAARALPWKSGLSAMDFRILFNVVAGFISCLLLGITSRRIQGKRTRNVFFWSCALFVLILSLVLIGRMLALA